jgi:hypothetical protein
MKVNLDRTSFNMQTDHVRLAFESAGWPDMYRLIESYMKRYGMLPSLQLSVIFIGRSALPFRLDCKRTDRGSVLSVSAGIPVWFDGIAFYSRPFQFADGRLSRYAVCTITKTHICDSTPWCVQLWSSVLNTPTTEGNGPTRPDAMRCATSPFE